jgi:hypothetical protein
MVNGAVLDWRDRLLRHNDTDIEQQCQDNE